MPRAPHDDGAFKAQRSVNERVDHRQAAQFIADRLMAEHGQDIERIILYGSVARGEAGPESDVDLVIVARDFLTVHRALTPLLGDLLVADAPLVSAMVLTMEQFVEMQRRNTTFYRTLVREGELLVA